MVFAYFSRWTIVLFQNKTFFKTGISLGFASIERTNIHSSIYLFTGLDFKHSLELPLQMRRWGRCLKIVYESLSDNFTLLIYQNSELLIMRTLLHKIIIQEDVISFLNKYL